MRLSELAIGTEAIVRSVDVGSFGEGRRLQEVGFVPGTRVRAERRAPMGDPTVYVIRSTRLALRSQGAALIEVEIQDGREVDQHRGYRRDRGASGSRPAIASSDSGVDGVARS
jgi:Fe2+ transport system protein FeoA